jgi:formamidopyrimidine-DNA glycosylase
MPELPDVEMMKRYFDSTSLHKRIETVKVFDAFILKGISPRTLKSALSGHAFRKSTRHGKYLFAKLDKSGWLVMHFGMTGGLRYFEGEKTSPHTRVLIRFHKSRNLAFEDTRKLGRLLLAGSPEEFLHEKGIGPDALDEKLDFESFTRIFGHRGRAKPSFMDQHLVAGVGNIAADEILFHARVHPEAKLSSLSEKRLLILFRAMKDVLRKAIEREAGMKGFPEDWLLSHRYRGGKCPRCRTELERLKLEGRTGYYCPKCQK